MNRRRFLKNSTGLILTSGPLLIFATKALASADDAVIADLRSKDASKACQSVSGDDEAAVFLEVNPKSEAGCLSHSEGCQSPHKHLLFIPQRYLVTSDLIEQEADTQTTNGQPAKTFMTSHAYDMSWVVRMTVGAHQHSVVLSKADALQIAASGLDKIAYQKAFLGGATEPGHVFHLAIN